MIGSIKPDIFGEVKANLHKADIEAGAWHTGESLTIKQQLFPNRSNPNHDDGEQTKQKH